MDYNGLTLVVICFLLSLPSTSAACYNVWNSNSRYNVCDPIEIEVNKEWTKNLTQTNDIWFLLSKPLTIQPTNLISIEATPYGWLAKRFSQLIIRLYDQNGTTYMSPDLNYPFYSGQFFQRDPTLYIRALSSSVALPFLLHVHSLTLNGSNWIPGIPIGFLSITLHEGNSYAWLDQTTSYSDTVTPYTWLFRSWVLPKLIDYYSQIRLTQFSSNCNASSFNIVSETCITPLMTECNYPIGNLKTVNGKMEDGKTVILGYPLIDGYDDLVILGLFNNGTKNCDVKMTTYNIIANTVELESVLSNSQCVPGRYEIFYIPYNPFNGERLPPLINITATVTPKSSNKARIGIFYSNKQNLANTNFISATQQNIQTQDNLLQPLTLVFSSEGPFEYVSIYNFGTETAEFSISISKSTTTVPPPPPPGGIVWWVWLCVGLGVPLFIGLIAFIAYHPWFKRGYRML